MKKEILGEMRLIDMKVKRICSFLMTLTISLALSIPAMATGENVSCVYPDSLIDNIQVNMTEDLFNEYDHIVAIRNMTENELAENGITEAEASFYTSDAPEKELLFRASLPEEVLRNEYCYSDTAIKLIKSYDGTPLEDAPEMRAAAATLSAGLDEIMGAPKQIGMIYSCEWGSRPLGSGEDAAGVAWDATYEDGGNNNARLNSQDSYAQITYHGGISSYTETVDLESKDLHQNAYVEFDFERDESEGGTTNYVWAKKIRLTIFVDLANSSGPKFVELVAHGEYGHSGIGVSAGISFPFGISISFNPTVDVYGDRNLTVLI
ncbi:hypothetical protein [Dysosmobacter welbionis]